MNDKEKTELLSDVLHALLGDKLKGKFIVEVKATVTLNANSNKDAQRAAIEYVKAHPEEWNAFAIKVDDLINHD